MIDPELVTIMSAITICGLIVAGVVALGLTRVEKILAAIYFGLFCAQLITLKYFVAFDPELNTAGDVDNWLNTMHRGRTVTDILWWGSTCAGATFLIISAHHIWRERDRIIDHISIK